MSATQLPGPAVRAAPGGLPRAGRRAGRPAARAAADHHRRRSTSSSGDIAELWNNLFIETCDEWVIPYIGDLVANNLLYDPSRIGERDTAAALFADLRGPDLRPRVAVRTRADVAKTIYYRRRKGTLPMLEELARDVTGWAAHAVEFFELLGWTSTSSTRRPQAAWFDLRSPERGGARRRAVRRGEPHRRRAPDLSGRGLARDPQRRLLPVAARQLSAARRARSSGWRRHGGFTSARWATPRRCSPTCAAKATRPG